MAEPISSIRKKPLYPNAGMSYHELHHQLQRVTHGLQPRQTVDFEHLRIFKMPFHASPLSFPDVERQQSDPSFHALLAYYLSHNQYSNQYVFRSLTVEDRDVMENQVFHPLLFCRRGKPADHLIVLLNGLNEKTWDKYLTWAFALSQRSHDAVLLFPTAFHIDRAPADWSNARFMRHAARERQQLFPEVTHSSLANAAISYRLQFAPERFLYAGLQTCHDIMALMWQIRSGRYAGINRDARVDLLGYSAGAFVGEVLMMANPGHLFEESRLLMFCGGAAMNLTRPISKMIMDSEASLSLFNYLTTFYQSGALTYKSGLSSEFIPFFEALLHETHLREFRNRCFKKMGSRMLGIGLKGDTVIPPEAIQHTLEPQKTGAQVEQMRFNHPCCHEMPFPLKPGIQPEVNVSFNNVMETAGDFFAV